MEVGIFEHPLEQAKVAYKKAESQGRRRGSAKGQTGKTTRMVLGKDNKGVPKR